MTADAVSQEASVPSADSSASAESGGADAELLRLREQLATAESAVGAARDQQLRAAAEMENIRRRAAREVESAQKFALEKFATELLAVRDSLEQAVHSEGADAAALRAGQQATLRLLEQAFDRYAIKAIRPAGEPFDPASHEAMLSQPSAEVPAGSVLQVLQTGYQLNGRLLRPARVIVANAPAEPAD